MRRALPALLALLVVGGGCGREDAHLARARTLMATEQWANARTALGRALASHPRDTTARALLMYCLDREDSLEQIAELSRYALLQFVTLPQAPGWDRTPTGLRRFVEDRGVEARKVLVDRSIDTTSNADLAAVLVASARHGFAHDQDPERRDLDAAILAMGTGDAPAIAYLVGRLQGQTPDPVIRYLVDTGAPAVAPLRAAVADAGFIGRRPALTALARLLAGERAQALVTTRPTLRDPTEATYKVAARERLGPSVLSSAREPDLLRVHATYAAIDTGADDGLVLLQAWDDSKGVVVAELHAQRGGQLTRLAIKDAQRATIDLGGASVVFDLTVEDGVIGLHRLRTRTLDVETETGRVRAPTPGARVRLQGYAPHGVIVREDAGLWVVRVDQPIDGMTELPVAASALIGLETVKRTDVAVETLAGKVKSDTFEVIATDVATEQAKTGALPASCRAFQMLVERLLRCDRLPASSRKGMETAYDTLVAGWARRDLTDPTLPERCTTQLDDLRPAAASLCGL